MGVRAYPIHVSPLPQAGHGAKPPWRRPDSTSRGRPRNPVPTRGGNTLVIPVGVYDQRPLEERRDVLGYDYTSEPLTRALEITGPIKVTLYAASSVPDTGFS